jgi:hypothetical protein
VPSMSMSMCNQAPQAHHRGVVISIGYRLTLGGSRVGALPIIVYSEIGLLATLGNDWRSEWRGPV